MTPEMLQGRYGHHHPDFQRDAAEGNYAGAGTRPGQKDREQSATNVAKRDENHRYFKGSTMSRNVRDEGVAGSNPATPTSSTNKALIGHIFLPTLSI
jgi:hypothetical protein